MSVNGSIARLIASIVELLYLKPIRKIMPITTFRYAVCGVVNSIVLDTIFYYLIYHYIVGKQILRYGSVAISAHVAAMILVFPITFLIGFWLNRNVAFKATRERSSRQIAKYALTVAGSIVLSYLSLKFLVETMHIWATPAKTISSIIVALYSYLAARFFTFRR